MLQKTKKCNLIFKVFHTNLTAYSKTRSRSIRCNDEAYFDSVDGRTPHRWSSTSLSRSQTALAHLDEVVSSVVLACDFK